MQFRRLVPSLACTILALSSAAPALAQGTYPDRPVKVIVALPAGGSADMIARVVTQKMATELGQPFVVDNKAGASGQIGTPLVSRAAPDGYTLMVSPASFLTTNKSIFKTLPYDPETDFIPITKFVNQPMVLVVKDKQKFPTVAAVLAAAKAAPGKLTFASSGDGSPQHLAGLMFTTRTKTDLLHVPYKGGAPAINDTLAGTVDMLFAVLPEALPHIQSGKLHALGLDGRAAHRHPAADPHHGRSWRTRDESFGLGGPAGPGQDAPTRHRPAAARRTCRPGRPRHQGQAGRQRHGSGARHRPAAQRGDHAGDQDPCGTGEGGRVGAAISLTGVPCTVPSRR